MRYHMIAFLLGFLLDQVIGDPQRLPHPIRLIGRLISFLERQFLGKERERNAGLRKQREMFLGGLMCGIMMLLAGGSVLALVVCAYTLHVYIGMAAEAVLTCYILAAKSLRDESMRVHHALEHGTLAEAREAVGRIVGRDTAELDEAGVIRATVETVAENTSDGVIAPLLYTWLGGPVLGFLYKAVNTMDSMTGYHNERYEYFGKLPARMDDLWNFLPSRISAVLMLFSACVGGREFSGSNAYRIFKRDRRKHKSPNAAQTESVCAGALSVRLAGPARYFGRVVDKPFIGDDLREITREDIKRACKLMYLTEYFCVLALVLILVIAGLLH